MRRAARARASVPVAVAVPLVSIAVAPPEVGKWSAELFARYKAAKGERKRTLLGELLRVNGPLIKLLVAQLCGIADERTSSRRRTPTRSRIPGCENVPWEDLLQAGYEGFQAALERFDPAKGKISGYARYRIMYSLQKLMRVEHFVHVPDGKWDERPGVSFLGDETILDRLAGHEESAISGVEGLTPELIAEWQRTGDWPEFDAWQAAHAPVVPAPSPLAMAPPEPVGVVYSIPRDPLVVFLDARCMFTRTGRVGSWDLWNTVRLAFRRDGHSDPSRVAIARAVASRGVTPGWQRTPTAHSRGTFVGMKVVGPKIAA